MAVSYTIIIDRHVGENFAAAWEQATQELVPAFLEQVRGDAIEGTPVFDGFARGSWQTPTLERLSPVLMEGTVFSNLDYMSVIEKGRRPDKPPPPSSVLIRWVTIKLGVSPKQAPGVAYVVARAIGRRGLPAKRPLGNAIDKNAAFADQIFERDIPARITAIQAQKF
jgi:hypothetical protein